MKLKPGLISIIVTVLLLYITWFWMISNDYSVSAYQSNQAPVLENPGVYFDHSENQFVFYVEYQDPDGDNGDVLLYIKDRSPVSMGTGEIDPVAGQYYEVYIPKSNIDDDSEFYYEAEDSNGAVTVLKDEYDAPFLIGDFDGWGDPPILSGAYAYFDGDDWVFNVTYYDPDGDEANYVDLCIDDEYYAHMETTDTDPLSGQNFVVHVLEADVDEKTTEFHFEAEDTGGSYSYLYDEGGDFFSVDDFVSDTPVNDDNHEDDEDDDEGSLPGLPEGWGEPEVIIGIIALVAMGAGSAIGVWHRKKKRGRFTELLTQIDDVYGSYKTNPRKCEFELEKIKSEANEDLKHGTIDESNYSLIKDRADELKREIRSEVLHSRMGNIPQEMELKIKDMLIDGKISRSEYKKFMVILKSADMSSSDKKEMKKLVDSWMKEDVN